MQKLSVGRSVQLHATVWRHLEKLRDTLYREDQSHTRTRSGPGAMATLRNLAIGAL